MAELNFKIGSDRNPVIISLKEFKGRKLIDIRKNFPNQNDKNDLIPTKKGISLNESQLSELLKKLNENKSSIEQHFQQIHHEDINIDLRIGSLLGRKFNFDFENKKTDFVIDPDLANRIGEDHIQVVKKSFYSFYKALLDVIEDDNDIEHILDMFSNNLNRTKW